EWPGKVGRFDDGPIQNRDPPEPGAHRDLGRRSPDGAHADEDDGGPADLFLPGRADSRKEDGSGVALAHRAAPSSRVRAWRSAVSGTSSPASIRAISAMRSFPSSRRTKATVRPRTPRFSASKCPSA